MKIYTRTGDDGTTALFGGGRVEKTHARITAYGTVDELNSFVGLARSYSSEDGNSAGTEAARLDDLLAALQSDLFVLGADLATPSGTRAQTPRIGDEHVRRLESTIDELQEKLPVLKNFILPGGSQTASALHVARTVCRRAERRVLEAAETEDLTPGAAVYLNRLSDYLFVLARWANHIQGGTELTWSSEM